MRRFARLPSRILAVSAATFLGAVGAVAFAAAPASAHTAALTYDAVCGAAPDTVDITWKVTNDQPNKFGTLKRVSRPVGDIKDDARVEALQSLTGKETVKVADGSPTLSLRMRWRDADDKTVEATADVTKLDCGPAEPATEPKRTATSNCDGTLTVVVTNADDKARKIAINGQGEYNERKTLKAGETWEHVVPKAHAGTVRVKWKTAKENDDTDTGWEGDEKFNWAQPEACFDVAAKSTCEDLTISVTNTGPKAIKAAVTVGDESKQVEIESGKSAEIAIDAVDGLVAKLAVTGGYSKDFAWAKPADCSGGPLPVTGANAGLLAGVALVLVSGGGGLFFMARRRRVRFAA